jgi:hypothetical protein
LGAYRWQAAARRTVKRASAERSERNIA